MKKWRCTVCNYIHEGDEPPEKCPRCGSPREVFVPYEEDVEDVISDIHQTNGDTVADVVIVGSGAAAFAAAITAISKGSKVLMIEKADKIGGTTRRSGGGYWIPNNQHQKAAGYNDNKDDAFRYMARYSYPNRYDPKDDKYGLTEHQFDLINSFYDNASEMVDHFENIDVFHSMIGVSWNGKGYSDYGDNIPENKGIRGRLLFSKNEKGEMSYGFNLIALFEKWAIANDITIVTGCRVTDVIERDGTVIGVEADQSGKKLRFLARQGVMFGTGGYSHNAEFMQQFQPGPIYGGCAVPSNTGDFIPIAGKIGAQIGNTRGAFRADSLIELFLKDSTDLTNIFFIPGDNAILVDKYGNRYVNEKRNYNDRGKRHFEWDEMKAEYKNMLTFLIADHRTATLWQNDAPFPAKGDALPDHLITAGDLDSLADRIAEHLKKISKSTGNFSLDPKFKDGLKNTVKKFNGYAKDGKDPDFDRGKNNYDSEWITVPSAGVQWPDKNSKNITMHPIEEPPYYAAILGSGTLDTNGGPVIDGKARVLRWDQEPIDGLYGAGNCIASPTADTYWGGGSTIGPAMTFGYIAGKQLSARDRKEFDV